MKEDSADKQTNLADLREENRRLENIIALMPGHVYWLNRDNIYLGCNNLQAESVSLISRHEIAGKTNQDLIWKDQAEDLNAINALVMETGEALVVEETVEYPKEVSTFLSPNNPPGKRIYLSQKVPLHNEEGSVVGILGISFDISERKRMEKELQEAKEKAEIANRTKSDFIRNMEHDIRTPLSGMMSVAAYLGAKEEEPQKKELLGDLGNASKQLMTYLNSIIEISRLSEGGIPLIKGPFDLKELVSSMFMLELPAAKNKALDFSLDYSEEVPTEVLGDSFRTYRILLNLVSNAIKFTEKGWVKVRVDLLRKTSTEAEIQFTVEDSGSGIDQQDREKIYEKFSCGTQGKKKNIGMGMGLWIVQQFLRDLDGDIELQSEVGKGSTFRCRMVYQLPAKQV